MYVTKIKINMADDAGSKEKLDGGIYPDALTDNAPPILPPDGGAQNARDVLLKMAALFKPTVESMRKQLAGSLYSHLQEDVRMLGEDGINFDHYLLVLGNEKIGKNKRLLDRRFVHVSQPGEPYFLGDDFHAGSIAYALLRSKVDPSKKVAIPGGKSMPIGELIFYPLQHVEEKGYKITNHDVEWLVLLAVESLKRGRPTKLKFHNGKEIKLEDLLEVCRDEFDYVYHRERFTAQQIKEKFHNRDVGNCGGLHALHALFAYAVLKNDNSKINEYCDFIFSKIQDMKKTPEKISDEDDEKISEKIDFIAHLLTPLTELPRSYTLSTDRKALIKWAVDELMGEVGRYDRAFAWKRGREKQQNKPISSPSIGPLSHALDVLKYIPAEWCK